MKHLATALSISLAGTDLGVTMQIILPVGVGRTVRMSYLESDLWLDGSDAVVGVQNKSISTAAGFYNLTYDFSRFGPILPHATWEYHLGYATDPRLADTDGDGFEDNYEIGVFHSDPLSRDGDGESGDPDDDGLSNLSEFAFGTDPVNSHTFSPETGDAEYVGYGMCAFPPLNGVSVAVSVGDPSGSLSERWKITPGLRIGCCRHVKFGRM